MTNTIDSPPAAPHHETLVERIRELIDQAQAAGEPMPGRPTLVKRTGATDYRVRLALAELAKQNDTVSRDVASASDPAGDDTASGEPGEYPESPEPVVVAAKPLTVVDPPADLAALGLVAGRQDAAGVPPAPSGGGRLVAWAGFVFGSVMSVAANVLHTWLPADRMPAGWVPGVAAQIGAAVWPIGLLLSVEVLSRVSWRPGWPWMLARFGGTGTVALGSAVISYGHVRDVLAAWGYGPLAAHVGPLVLDGLMVISGFALLAMSGQRQSGVETSSAD